MLDLPDAPVLDKLALVGSCSRLPLKVDAPRLRDEVARLPPEMWGTAGGRVGVHAAAEALFLRGYAPAEGEKPIEDREPLRQLPYVQWIIRSLIPAPPQRCLLARLAAGASIAPHIDRAPYFSKTIRVHVPVATHEQAYMLCGETCYLMSEGEVWAINNTARHGVWNAHAIQSRTHLICDFLLNADLRELLARADRSLGSRQSQVERHFALALQRGGGGG